jgi:hypothetical protein
MQCPLCGDPRIVAAYRTADASYLACEQCKTVWAVEVAETTDVRFAPPMFGQRRDSTERTYLTATLPAVKPTPVRAVNHPNKS